MLDPTRLIVKAGPIKKGGLGKVLPIPQFQDRVSLLVRFVSFISLGKLEGMRPVGLVFLITNIPCLLL